MRVWFLIGIAAAVFYIFSVVDCAMADRARVRALPKQAWVVVIVLFPVIGGVLWLLIGRGSRPQPAPAGSRTLAPDDDPEFLARLRREHDNERRLRNLEEKLSDRDDTKRDTDPGPRDA